MPEALQHDGDERRGLPLARPQKRVEFARRRRGRDLPREREQLVGAPAPGGHYAHDFVPGLRGAQTDGRGAAQRLEAVQRAAAEFCMINMVDASRRRRRESGAVPFYTGGAAAVTRNKARRKGQEQKES